MIITLVTFIMQVLKQTNFFEMTSITSTEREQQVQQQLDDDGENCRTQCIHAVPLHIALKMEKSAIKNDYNFTKFLIFFFTKLFLAKNISLQQVSQLQREQKFREISSSDTKRFSYSFAPGHPCSNYFHLFRKLSRLYQ